MVTILNPHTAATRLIIPIKYLGVAAVTSGNTSTLETNCPCTENYINVNSGVWVPGGSQYYVSWVSGYFIGINATNLNWNLYGPTGGCNWPLDGEMWIQRYNNVPAEPLIM